MNKPFGKVLSTVGALSLLFAFATAQEGNAQITYTYTGQPYNPDTHVCNGTYEPCTQLYVQGSFTLPHTLAPNLVNHPFTPSSFSFTDNGSVTLGSGSGLAVSTFQASTDENGNITVWNIVLEQIANSNACAGISNELLGTYGWPTEETGGDYSCYNNLQNYGAGGNVNVPGCWLVNGAAAAPTIMFNGADVTGQTTSVVVGQEIMLTGQAPSCGSIASQQWSVPPTKNAVGGFTPTTSSFATGSVTPLPTDTTTTSYGPFYWTYPGKYRMTYQYTTSSGAASPVSTATFEVVGPTGVEVTTKLGEVQILEGPALGFGASPGTPGISLESSGTALSGSFTWVQLVNGDVIKETPSSGGKVVTCYGPETPTPGVFPALDNVYPYDKGTVTNDSPETPPFPSGYKKVSRAFSAKMTLMWTPTPDARCTDGDTCTIPVPLGYVDWKFGATATLTESGNWEPSGSGTVQEFVKSTSYPEWKNWATNGACVGSR